VLDKDLTDDTSWWDTDWTLRQQLTFTELTQGNNLTGFPVLVTINSSRIDYGNTQDAGEDLRFVDSDDSTALNYEIDGSWSESGTTYVWVQVPQIDADSADFIYMYYGNTDASDNQSVSGVWDVQDDGTFKGVWHLAEDPSGAGPQMTDSTGFNNDGSSSGFMTTSDQILGNIDGSLDFDGSNDSIEVSSTFGLGTTNTTIAVWVNLDSTSEGGPFVKIGGDLDGYGVGVGASTFDDTGNDLIMLYENIRWIDTPNPIGTGWHHVVMIVQSNTNPEGYIDGVSVYTDGGSGPASPGSNTTYFGGYAARHVDVNIADVRISNTVRTADWIAATYDSERDAFMTYGAEESATKIVTLLNHMQVSNNLSFSSGTFDTGAFDLTVAGNVDLNANASLDGSDAASDIFVGANWDATGGAFIEGTGSVYFYGASNGNVDHDDEAFYNVTIKKTSATATLTGHLTLSNNLSVNTGTLNQGATFGLDVGGHFEVSSGGILTNVGTGYLKLGGDLSNEGTITLDGSGVGCGGGDAIELRSSVADTQRKWSGGGTFASFFDLDVKDMGGSITTTNSTNTGNNAWTFVTDCGSGSRRVIYIGRG